MGKEVGEQGTPHIQGYCEVATKVALSKMKKVVGPRANLHVCKGSDLENWIYCVKDGDHIELGAPMRQGQRTDIDAIRVMIEEGKTELDLAQYDFTAWMRNYRAFARYRQLIQEPRTWMTEAIILIGQTRCGKTRWVHEDVELRGLSFWRYSGDGWFDGYEGQEAVLFDDFYGDESGLSYSMWLQIIDRYPMQVKVKGAFVNWAPKVAYFTSNITPDFWYPKVPNIDALYARVAEHGTFIDESFWE